jgi:hypothetical protein
MFGIINYMRNKSIIQAINKLEDTAIYCDQWVSAYCERFGEIELHLSEVESEVMICTQKKTVFVSLGSITQENIRNFLESKVEG